MAPKAPEPQAYLLRGIDPVMWAAFAERAQAEGVTMRTAILKAVRAYVDGEIELVAVAAGKRTKGGAR